ncbi:MAG: GNAT family N-acetyltransferase [Candidatus Diapherotrites archaeon]|nr:GNAT family N-acetyltransferase [Candidatus Diapherotrites archaeon]
MKISSVEKNDLIPLKKILSKEFSYLKWDPAFIENRLSDPSLKMFKLMEGKKFVGFIELEFMDELTARINGLAVKNGFRRQGHAKKLIDFALAFLESTGIEEVNLLVRKSNQHAKKLYESKGFYLAGIHDRKIQGETIEVYAKPLAEKDYLN